jgi:hypothetical protein
MDAKGGQKGRVSSQSSPADDTLFPASERTPGQAQSRLAYRDIEEQLAAFPWWADYVGLRSQGWDWRKAVYIAWSASPGVDRLPPTQERLAVDVLGLSSDRVISKWREKQPQIETAIVELAAAPLLRHRRDIYDALIQCAIDPDPKTHQDRKLALELLGDYKPRSVQEQVGEDGGPVVIKVVYEDEHRSTE